MKTIPLLLFCCIFTFGCSAPRHDLEKRLIGRWALVRIYERGEDVSRQHNPERDRWIHLHADGTFVSDGEPYGRNGGRWTFDSFAKILRLDSDAGEGDDSSWIVRIDGRQMSWQGTDSPFTERFRLELLRRKTW